MALTRALSSDWMQIKSVLCAFSCWGNAAIEEEGDAGYATKTMAMTKTKTKTKTMIETETKTKTRMQIQSVLSAF